MANYIYRRNELQDSIDRLKAVNSELWIVEDDLRIMENSSRFDNAFIELARSVYRLNDKRAELKRKINDLTGSKITEEKSYWQKDTIDSTSV